MRLFKFILVSVAGLVVVGALGSSAIKAYRIGETMTLKEAEKRWGKEKLSEEKFKNGSPAVRARMIVDLIQTKRFEGKPVKEVFDSLGWSDGHFFSDMVPAYIVEEGNKALKKDTWQVVFLLTGDSQRISEVIIHKNCCSKEIWESVSP